MGPIVALIERAYREALAAKDREITAKDREITAKDELIAELRGRAERAERQLGDVSGAEREEQHVPSPPPASSRQGSGDRRPLSLANRIARWVLYHAP